MIGDQLLFSVLFFFYYIFQRIKISYKILLSLLFSSLFIYLIFYLKPSLFERFVLDTIHIISNFNDYQKGNWFQLYHRSFGIISYSFQNFIIGIGSKNFTKSCIEIFNVGCSTHPHNLYIEMFVSFGVVGFFIFCICVYKLCKFLIKLLSIVRLKDRFRVFTALFIQTYFLIPFLPSGALFALDLLIYFSILNSIVILNLLTLSDYYDFKKI